MAKSEFRFREFKWDKRGYNALKSWASVRDLLGSRARAIATSAEAASGEAYRTDVEQSARFERPYAVVATDGSKSAAENAEHNTLLKSVDAGRL